MLRRIPPTPGVAREGRGGPFGRYRAGASRRVSRRQSNFDGVVLVMILVLVSVGSCLESFYTDEISRKIRGFNPRFGGIHGKAIPRSVDWIRGFRWRSTTLSWFARVCHSLGLTQTLCFCPAFGGVVRSLGRLRSVGCAACHILVIATHMPPFVGCPMSSFAGVF